MSHEKAFLRAIYDHPYDDALWLVYADWLEEQGDPLAELIRIYSQLRPLGANDPRREALLERRRELLEAYQKEWAPYLKPLAGKAHLSSWRGPLDYLRIENAADDDLRHLAGRKEIRLLALEGQGITDDGLPHLLELPCLEELNLGGTAVTDEGMRIVARLPQLLGLGVSETEVTDVGIRHLRTTPRLVSIYCNLGDTVTEEGLDRWKQWRMRRFRKRSPEERRREADYAIDSISSTRRTGDPIKRIDFYQCQVSDLDLEYFTELTEVEEVDLSITHVTGRGLRHLSGLKNLRTLHAWKTHVDSLDGLTGLSNLQELGVSQDLGAEALTDDGTTALTTLTGLQVLELQFAAITDVTLQRLSGLTRLRVLSLALVTGITDTGLTAISNLKRLEKLDLEFAEWRGGQPITDAGIRHLAGLNKLIVLDLEGQSISDEGLIHLRGLRNLEHLELTNTKATVQGARGLLDSLPKVSIALTDAMVKHTNPHPHFTRRDVDGRVSFEVPDDWEVLDWEEFEQYLQIFEKPLAGQFHARLREDGYKHWSGSYTGAAPGEVSFNRFPAAKKRKLVTVHRAFVGSGMAENLRPGRSRAEAPPLPGTEALSWRYQTDNGTVQRLDYA